MYTKICMVLNVVFFFFFWTNHRHGPQIATLTLWHSHRDPTPVSSHRYVRGSGTSGSMDYLTAAICLKQLKRPAGTWTTPPRREMHLCTPCSPLVLGAQEFPAEFLGSTQGLTPQPSSDHSVVWDSAEAIPTKTPSVRVTSTLQHVTMT